MSEADRTVVKHGVTIVGETNLAARVGADASSLYARNVLDFLKLVLGKDGTFSVPMELSKSAATPTAVLESALLRASVPAPTPVLKLPVVSA